jgi:predicted exporter
VAAEALSLPRVPLLARTRAARWLAAGWALLVLVVVLHQVSFWRSNRVDTDVMALLPADERTPGVSQALRQIADSASRDIVVLVGAPQRDTAQAAARKFDAVWRERDAQLAAAGGSEGLAAAGQAIARLQPWRDRLLTPAQRERLQQAAPAALAEAALASLYQPGAGGRLSEFAADPLQLWPQWWAARLAASKVRPVDGLLMLQADGREWVVLRQRSAGDAFALDGGAPHRAALQAAADAAREIGPDVQVLYAGVPLHAEAAAARASYEINIIGWGSLAAIALLTWLSFRSMRPILMVTLSLGIGCMVALSVSALVFERVHIITLVFGASLVGVAEDFGIHYYASRQGQPQRAPGALMSDLLPGLALALLTSVLGYLVLGAAPFPGLRQMAVFSAAGLVGAFVTVVCWLPLLDGKNVHKTAFASATARSLLRWPQVRGDARWTAAGLLFAVACAAGLWQLRADDDLRQLQSSPAELMESQRTVARLLALPSPAQFFMVVGRDAQQVLEREEALKSKLAPLVAQGRLRGWQAVSDWVPPAAQQRADAALTLRVESDVLARVGRSLGETLQRPRYDEAVLEPPRAFDLLPVPALRGLWQQRADGAASVVLLAGLHPGEGLQAMAEVARTLDGVSWVDRTAQISQLMARYRLAMGGLLLLGFVAVFAALAWRFGRRAWRAWLPTVLACLIALALLGWMGQRLQLFHVLALILILGIGVDYGIFLLEHEGDGGVWVAVVLGAASTVLSFGLLALSATPALRAFGLTMLFGTTAVWLLSPCFCSTPRP